MNNNNNKKSTQKNKRVINRSILKKMCVFYFVVDAIQSFGFGRLRGCFFFIGKLQMDSVSPKCFLVLCFVKFFYCKQLSLHILKRNYKVFKIFE